MRRAKITKIEELSTAEYPNNMPTGLIRTGTLAREPTVNFSLELFNCDETDGKLFRTSAIQNIEPRDITSIIYIITTFNSKYKLELL